MTALRVVVVQLAVRDGAADENLARACRLIEHAPRSDLYLLPELWTTGYAHASWPAAARDDTPRSAASLSDLARRIGAAVGGSMISLDEHGRLVNRFWLFGPEGTIRATYDKTHLFEPMSEHRHLQRGARRVRVPLGRFSASLSLCYDLRFPEMYRLEALDGADLFLIASAWPVERIETMRVLARARAAENQAFLLLCNRTGSGRDGTRFGGRSTVIGPDGSLLAEAGDAEEVVVSELLPSALAAVRLDLPVFRQRVTDVDWRS